MDTEYDFIRPEFFDILFFQQKNLIIFPYVDKNHLHALEVFTEGHRVQNLDSTEIFDIIKILEYREEDDEYGISPNIYFISNVNREKIKQIMVLKDVRCIINTNENVSLLANGSNFVIYNKKSKEFINYDSEHSDLLLENELISESKDKIVLHDKVRELKAAGTKIFRELNNTFTLDRLPEILKDYDSKFWNKILDHVKFFYKINVPELDKKILAKQPTRVKISNNGISKKPSKYSREYEFIVKLNDNLTKEFVQLLHEYRANYINPSNLKISQLYSPEKLYIYLREHHWEREIPSDFLRNWLRMNNTGHKLSENDILDFENIFKKLGVSDEFLLNAYESYDSNENDKYLEDDSFISENLDTIELYMNEPMPSPKTKFKEYKKWLLDRIIFLEKLGGTFGNE